VAHTCDGLCSSGCVWTAGLDCWTGLLDCTAKTHGGQRTSWERLTHSSTLATANTTEDGLHDQRYQRY
jgi:hypothetical protein